ncbi:MepB family protein [Alkalicoccobacillus gibsonii]|uniref:MepB family protein n=1 Tax=Alkalicoccobacillus gibsonii TaxID=79881 RepID=A0ABU9VDX1_9BACI
MLSESLIRTTLQDNHFVGNIVREESNKDYEGFSISIDRIPFRSRLAKITPKKKGYFVALWIKDSQGVNQAYTVDQTSDKTIISVIDYTLHKKGQFVFPKDELIKRGITKTKDQKGKMGFRVYPDWVTDLNATAKKTQVWQCNYFIDLSGNHSIKELEDLYFQK